MHAGLTTLIAIGEFRQIRLVCSKIQVHTILTFVLVIFISKSEELLLK